MHTFECIMFHIAKRLEIIGTNSAARAERILTDMHTIFVLHTKNKINKKKNSKRDKKREVDGAFVAIKKS